MRQVKDVYTLLADWAPPALAESWDNVGLLVDCAVPVTKVLVTLDITPETVAEAAAQGCELIVAHHPVIFKGLKRLDDTEPAFLLARRGISAICMHTNLDAADGGVNDALIRVLGLADAEPFANGFGRVGTVPQTTAEQLARSAGAALHTAAKYADAGKPIRRLAVVCGGGASMFEDALAVGADCMLTGEAGHHTALDAVRLGMSLVALSHFATEQPVVQVLADRLAAACPDLTVLCSQTGRDPFTYI